MAMETVMATVAMTMLLMMMMVMFYDAGDGDVMVLLTVRRMMSGGFMGYSAGTMILPW